MSFRFLLAANFLLLPGFFAKAEEPPIATELQSLTWMIGKWELKQEGEPRRNKLLNVNYIGNVNGLSLLVKFNGMTVEPSKDGSELHVSYTFDMIVDDRIPIISPGHTQEVISWNAENKCLQAVCTRGSDVTTHSIKFDGKKKWLPLNPKKAGLWNPCNSRFTNLITIT